MAIILCPNIDDDHAPFPHRLVIKEAKTVKRFGKFVEIPRQELVICANCDCWIGVPNRQCGCSWRCHNPIDPIPQVRIPINRKSKAQNVR